MTMFSMKLSDLLSAVSTAAKSEFIRYFAVSILALAVDVATFSATLRWGGLSWATAATAGFLLGVVVAYLLSVWLVFSNRTFQTSPQAEFIGFLAIGIAGLGVTQGVLWVGIDQLGGTPEICKLVAAGVTFFFNFFVRRGLLFRHQLLSYGMSKR